METTMKKFDAVEVITTFELSNLVNRDGTIEGIISIIKKAWEDHYEDIGKVKLITITTNNIVHYK